MRSFIISYDLRAPGRNYQALYDALKNLFAGACPLVESTWLIRTNNKNAAAVRDSLWQHMDANDALVVFEWGGQGEAAWNGLNPNISAWVKQRAA